MQMLSHNLTSGFLSFCPHRLSHLASFSESCFVINVDLILVKIQELRYLQLRTDKKSNLVLEMSRLCYLETESVLYCFMDDSQIL